MIKSNSLTNSAPIPQLKEELEQLRKAMMESSERRPQSRGMSDGTGSENGSARPLDTEREKEVALIREQLEEHQRLLRESEVGRRLHCTFLAAELSPVMEF